MKDILLNEIKGLIEEKPKFENYEGYDDDGTYYARGYYAGYAEALETVLKMIEEK